MSDKRIKRQFIETVETVIITVTLRDGEKPGLIIDQGGDLVSIRVHDWEVIKDAIDRGIEAVGKNPDDEPPK